MAKKKQEQKGWAIFDRKGIFTINSVRYSRAECIGHFVSGSTMDWSECITYGWTCRKVVIREK